MAAYTGFKDERVDREDVPNYQLVSYEDNDPSKPLGRVYYRNGKVDPDNTYTERYCKAHKLGRFSKNETTANNNRNKAKEESDYCEDLSCSWNPFWCCSKSILC